jgi:hypothetical protein
MCRDSSVGIATSCTAGIQFLVGAWIFSLLHSVQTDFEAHPAYYPMGNGVNFPGVEQPGLEVDQSPQSSAEVENDGV